MQFLIKAYDGEGMLDKRMEVESMNVVIANTLKK